MTRSIQNTLENGVKHRVKYANKYAYHLVQSLEVLSQKDLLKESIKTAKYEKLEDIFDYSMQTHNYYDMFLISKKGKILFTMKKEGDLHTNLHQKFLKSSKFSKTYIEAITSKKTAISNFYFYEPSDKYAAFIVTPIIENQEVIGAVAIQLDIDNIADLASDYSGLGETGEIILAQEKDNRAVFINKIRNDKEEIFTRSVLLGADNGAPIQEAVLNRFGSGIYNDYEDVSVIAAWGFIDSFKIGMVIKIDTKEAYAPIEYLKNLSMIMGMIILMFVLYVIYRIVGIVKSLEKTRNQYKFAIDGTKDGLWDWDIKNNDVYFSLRLKNMLGYNNKEMESSFESWKRLVHPDDVERIIKEIELCHKDPKRAYHQMYRIQHKDGNYLWILDRGQTYFDENGVAFRMSGFHTDMTTQYELENALHKSQHRFEQFMKYIPGIVIVKDSKGIVVYANESANEFFKQKDVVGMSTPQIVPIEKQEDIARYDAKILKEGHLEIIEKIEDKDGNIRVLRILGFTIDVDDQMNIGLVIIDITQSYEDKKEISTQEEIMIAQSRHAAMGEMISMIAHQWRQPISAIAMDANNILADVELEMIDEKELSEASKNIIQQTQELSKTIDDFREFFAPNKNVEDILVADILEDALNVIGKSLENNNIEISKKVDETIRLKTYSRELMQVLINIIKNAKEALLDKKIQKKIEINIFEENDMVVIRICDNGGGINATIIDKIFTPYFTTKGEKNGTGLGLYMSKTIIEKHLKGIISAYNKSQGVCFEIKISEVI